MVENILKSALEKLDTMKRRYYQKRTRKAEKDQKIFRLEIETNARKNSKSANIEYYR